MTCCCGQCGSGLINPLGIIEMEPALGPINTAENDDIPIHIIPDNDIAKHFVDFDGECGCRPWIDEEADDLVWIHNAFDQREQYRTGWRQPN